MSIFVRARFDVREGLGPEFEEVALALRDAAAEEPGTLTYRWFPLPEPGAYLVLEEYADTAAALLHQENQAELLARAGRCADMTFVELHGPIGPELRAWARERPQVSVFPDLPERA